MFTEGENADLNAPYEAALDALVYGRGVIHMHPVPPEDFNLQETTMEGKKFDQDKPRMDLLPMDALLEIAKVLTFGAKKYGDRNWELGIDPQRLRAAQMRHDAATELGELTDAESGLSHAAHKATDALMELSLRLRASQKIIMTVPAMANVNLTALQDNYRMVQTTTADNIRVVTKG